MKFTRRSTFRKRTGHRQKYVTVKVTAIEIG
ncbi:MAG: bL21 family ribosomal protein [Planctomycetia bacterium]|nr:bL21 family ribosomal protein [Planctomycetia bacterium]